MPKLGDYLTSEQLSRSERVGDYLTSQQLSRSENIGMGNYLTTEEMAGAYNQMNGMGDISSTLGSAVTWVKGNLWLSLGALAAAGYVFRKDIKKLF